jgi:hypothetical protein
MTPRPGTVRDIVPVDLPRPRDLDSPGYLATRDRIFSTMGMNAHTGDAEAKGRSREALRSSGAPEG